MLPNASKLPRMNLDFQKFSGGCTPGIAQSARYVHSQNSQMINFSPYMRKNLFQRYDEEMCKTVGKIFSVKTNTGGSNGENSTSSVKFEPEECHYASSGNYSRGRGNFRKRSRGYGSFHPYKQRTSYSGCFVCGEKDHAAAKMCPNRKSNLPAPLRYILFTHKNT